MAVARPQAAGWGLGAALRWFPPLHAEWQPRVGWGTLPAVALAAAGLVLGLRLAETLPLRHLLVGSWVAGTAWLLSSLSSTG